jgi:pimeloyl-ACP methyl ester carboxylesterase
MPGMTGMRTAGAHGTVGSVRAREPDRSGFVVRDGVRLFYEVHGSGPGTVLLLPPWSISHSRMWKLQVPFLARHFRVVTFDARGNGRSDRPAGTAAYGDDELLADVVAVLDVLDPLGSDGVVGIGLSMGGRALLQLAAEHPERLRGALFVAPSITLEERAGPVLDFDVVRASYRDWQRWNRHYWRQDLLGFAEFFFTEVFPEPHSTRQVEDGVSWALQTDADTLVDSMAPERPALTVERTREYAARVTCPRLVVHGSRDQIVPVGVGAELARLMGAPFEAVVGGGHCVQARHPVWFNLRVRRFVEEVSGRASA